MRTPAHSSAASRGFTLIELLVVLVILGVIVATATLSVGVLGGDREIEDQARRLQAILAQTREEAELQGMDVGLYVAQGAYQFYRFDARRLRWEAIENDPLFATRKLPEGVRARLWVDSREVILKPSLPEYKQRDDDDENDRDEEEDLKDLPQITILSSGEINPFELLLEREGGEVRYRVFSQPDSTLHAEVANEQRR